MVLLLVLVPVWHPKQVLFTKAPNGPLVFTRVPPWLLCMVWQLTHSPVTFARAGVNNMKRWKMENRKIDKRAVGLIKAIDLCFHAMAGPREEKYF
jgi:hypothetical protein